MTRQWTGACIFVLSVVGGPLLANSLWSRGFSRPLSYLIGFALIAAGGLAVRALGGFPGLSRYFPGLGGIAQPPVRHPADALLL